MHTPMSKYTKKEKEKIIIIPKQKEPLAHHLPHLPVGMLGSMSKARAAAGHHLRGLTSRHHLRALISCPAFSAGACNAFSFHTVNMRKAYFIINFYYKFYYKFLL